MAASKSTHKIIYAALAGNVLVALTKFGAASITDGSAMLSEGIHLLVDSGNQLLLVHGIRRSSRPADDKHPLGYGRELYFWSFIVALLVFTLGVLEAATRSKDPASIIVPFEDSAVLTGIALA